MTKVMIGIQARSTSQRLPNKALTNLYNKPVLSWVVNACLDSAAYLNSARDLDVEVVILCPYGDKISQQYRSMNVIEGDENDVLSRYLYATKLHNPDYICRVTGDCPFLTGFLITNHITKAVDYSFDYLSNVDPIFRTEIDGRDIEVLSQNAMHWLGVHARTALEKEHVTIKLVKEKPKELKRGHVLNRLDMYSDVKLSVDTKDDLINADSRMSSFFKKKAEAEKDVGHQNLFFV